ncbi:MAG: PAS domain S-box protein, partial [Alphaproteobacteria bacterium]
DREEPGSMDGREQALSFLAGPQSAGREFFDVAARALIMGLGWRWAGVGRLQNDGRSVELLALRDREERCDMFSYDLDGTPCDQVYRIGNNDPHVYIPRGVCKQFPKDRILIELGAVSYRGEVFYDDRGGPAGHVFAINDTARKDDPGSSLFFRLVSQRVGAEFNRWQMEQALSDSEQRFHTLFQKANDEIFIIDPGTGRFRDANESACKTLGYSRDELLSMAVHDLYPPNEADGVAASVADVSAGKNLVFERRPRRKDGTSVPVEVSSQLIAYGNEKVILSIARNITDRKHAEEALRAGEARLRQIIDLVPHLIYVKDRDGRFLLVNKKLAETYGTTVVDLTGALESERLCDPVAAGRYHEDDLEVITSGRSKFIPEEEFVDAKGRKHIYQTTKVPYRLSDRDGPAVLGVSVDITEQKMAQAKARQHESELAHVLRMGTMWEMASGLGHQINQPLTAIANFAGGALRRLRDGKRSREEIIEALEQIYQEANRASEVVRHLNRFIRKAEPRPALMDVNEIVRSALDLARAEFADGKVKLELRLSSDLPAVTADPVQIEQAFLNLVRNAIEAMQTAPARDRRIVVRTAVSNGDGVAAFVSDSGPGVSAADTKRIFDPFFTTKPNGMGMGLSITRTIVEAHGGSVDILKRRKKGVTFRIVLPTT